MAAKMDAAALEHVHVVLLMLSHLQVFGILQQRTQCLEHPGAVELIRCARIVVTQWDVRCVSGFGAER